MKFKSIINTNTIVKELMLNNIKRGSNVLDCTVGNGNDTFLLAKLVGTTGKVYGFDIQSQAIDNTCKLLGDSGLRDIVTLIKDSHEFIDKYIDEKLSFIIYNLGYLPKGDKSIKTNSVSTIRSVEKALKLLDNNGLLVLTVYTGHEGGMEEKDVLEEFFTKLNQKEFNVLKYDFINQVNNPPLLYCVEKSI
jgi:tRNA A58 N-methylase Trm61